MTAACRNIVRELSDRGIKFPVPAWQARKFRNVGPKNLMQMADAGLVTDYKQWINEGIKRQIGNLEEDIARYERWIATLRLRADALKRKMV